MDATHDKRCTGKIRHETRAGGERAIVEMYMKGRDVNGLNIYLCPCCGFYHVGHRSFAQERLEAQRRELLLERQRRKAAHAE